MFKKYQYKFAKNIVLTINYQKFEKQILLKNVICFIIKIIINKIFVQINLNIFKQIMTLQTFCSNLLIEFLSRFDAKKFEFLNFVTIAKNVFLIFNIWNKINSKIHNYLKKIYLRKHDLLIKSLKINYFEFEFMMRFIMLKNRI